MSDAENPRQAYLDAMMRVWHEMLDPGDRGMVVAFLRKEAARVLAVKADVEQTADPSADEPDLDAHFAEFDRCSLAFMTASKLLTVLGAEPEPEGADLYTGDER